MALRSLRKKSLGFILIVLFFGALIGSTLGEIIALILPEGVVKEFFLRSVSAGLKPFTLNAVMFKFTLGFTFKLNVIGILGIALAAYLLRWY